MLNESTRMLRFIAKAKGGFFITHRHFQNKQGKRWRWNPLVWDKDMLDLEIDFEIDTIWFPDYVMAVNTEKDIKVIEKFEDHKHSRLEAKRLAIAKAVAEIGKRMPKKPNKVNGFTLENVHRMPGLALID